MAKNGFIRQWLRSIALIFAIMWLTATVIVPATAQQVDESRPTVAREPASDTLPDTTKAINGSTNVELTATDLLDIDLIRPKRVKPEQPFYFNAQYTQRFDDNVLLREQGSASDLISAPQIGFGAMRVRSGSLMRVDYLGGAEIHQRFSEFDGVFHSLDAAWQYDLSKRTMLFVGERFFQRPLTNGSGVFDSSPDLDAAALNLLIPTKTIINDLTIGFAYQIDKFSVLRASYGYSLSRFNNPQLIGTDEHEGELVYTRQVSRTRSYDLAYRASFFLGNGNLITHTLLPSLSYRPRNRLRLRFGAGPQFVFSAINNRKLFLTALAELRYQAARTTYALTYTTGVGTGGGLATVTRNQVLFGTVEHLFGEKWRTEFRLGYSRARNSLGTTVTPFLPTDSTNNQLIIGSRSDYVIGNKIGVFFEYLHSTQNGAGTVGGDVSRNLFSIGISFDTRRSARAPKLMRERF